jgi:agmatinase
MTSPFALLKPKDGFLSLEGDLAVSYEEAGAVIIPFGLEASVSYGGGTENGPAAMIAASHEVELFDEELWCEPIERYGLVTAREPVIDNSDIEAALKVLEAMTTAVLGDGKFPFVFGG